MDKETAINVDEVPTEKKVSKFEKMKPILREIRIPLLLVVAGTAAAMVYARMLTSPDATVNDEVIEVTEIP